MSTNSLTYLQFLTSTQSIPAVRLYAKRTKQKTLKKWLEALPRARMDRVAREQDQHTLLGNFFSHIQLPKQLIPCPLGKMFKKWAIAYKTKITLKAVAYVLASAFFFCASILPIASI